MERFKQNHFFVYFIVSSMFACTFHITHIWPRSKNIVVQTVDSFFIVFVRALFSSNFLLVFRFFFLFPLGWFLSVNLLHRTMFQKYEMQTRQSETAKIGPNHFREVRLLKRMKKINRKQKLYPNNTYQCVSSQNMLVI